MVRLLVLCQGVVYMFQGNSRLEDVAEMFSLYVEYSLEVLFNLVDVAQVFYLYVECQLEVLLDLPDVA